jgi:K+-sensing histidine kinase KdpD
LLSVLRRATAPSLVWGIVVAASFIVVETLAVLLLKRLDPQEAFETLYLLGVLVVSTVWGLGLATTMSVASAIALAYLRNWPDRHFAPFNLENGVVVIFLIVALLTSARTRWRPINAAARLACSPNSRPRCDGWRHWSRAGSPRLRRRPSSSNTAG